MHQYSANMNVTANLELFFTLITYFNFHHYFKTHPLGISPTTLTWNSSAKLNPNEIAVPMTMTISWMGTGKLQRLAKRG